MTRNSQNTSRKETKGSASITFDVYDKPKVQIVATFRNAEKSLFVMTPLMLTYLAESVTSLLKMTLAAKKRWNNGNLSNSEKKNIKI